METDPTVIVTLIALYFLPTFIVVCRSHCNSASISILNLLLGWTVIGWLVALIWSVSAGANPSRS